MSQEIEWLLQEKYGGIKTDAFFADTRRLALGEPLGYLIGYVPFLDCKIWLDSRPLIPRPETEFWTEQAIKKIKATENPNPTILDLCAGSGCIGVAVAKALPHSHVDFSEIDASHLTTIEKNLIGNGISKDRYAIHHANGFYGIQQSFDFILSNPPYIDMDLQRTDESVLTYEPYVALSGGLAGLEIIEDIIGRAADYLKPHGQLWIEHEPEQSRAIAILGAENNYVTSVHMDQYNVQRYSILVLK